MIRPDGDQVYSALIGRQIGVGSQQAGAAIIAGTNGSVDPCLRQTLHPDNRNVALR